MTEAQARTHQDSVVVDATPEEVYDLISDITRTGEWSPVCTSCWWDDAADAGRVGAWFTGCNELPDRTWETRSQVVAADRGREFAWLVGGAFVRWGFTFEAEEEGTRLTETWDFLPEGLSMFADKFGDRAANEIEDRTRQAHAGIPTTLASIKQIAETA
jgi:hypothetical protein